jgi:hypothetical protein
MNKSQVGRGGGDSEQQRRRVYTCLHLKMEDGAGKVKDILYMYA